MLAQFLAVMAQAAVAAAPANTVSPVTVTPKALPPPADVRIEMQGSDSDMAQVVAIWPAGAYDRRLDGRVTLRCHIDVHGLAERCTVVSEEPAGQGFGAAALELRTTIKLEPSHGADGPIAMDKNIAISFRAPDTRVDLARLAEWQRTGGAVPAASTDIKDFLRDNRNGLQMSKETMLNAPLWVAAASFDDLAAAYPAKGEGAEGYAAAHCRVLPTGALSACEIIKETPGGHDFGKAATKLAMKFRIDPAVVAQAPKGAPLWVDVPIRMPPPAALADRTINAPQWTAVFDPNDGPTVFPHRAAEHGRVSGLGVARCTVGPDGALTACEPQDDPTGLGFSDAAVLLAAKMKMNLWAADATPVQGGQIYVPIRLNIRGPAS